MPSHSSFIYKIIGIGLMFLCLLSCAPKPELEWIPEIKSVSAKVTDNTCVLTAETSAEGKKFNFILESLDYDTDYVYTQAASWLTFYAGAGYGKRQLLWQDVDGGWAEVSDWSVKGLEMEAGAIFRWNRLAFSAGVSTVRFRTCSATVGVGFCF